MSLWSFSLICLNSQKNDKNKQECIPVGCVPSAAVGFKEGGVSQHALGRGVPVERWAEFLTHACENITFPQLRLRTVKITNLSHDISRSAVSLKPSTKKTPIVFYREDMASHKRSH